MARTKTASKTESKGKTEDEVLKAAVKRFDDWKTYSQPYRDKAQRDWKLRHGIRVKYAYKGVSDTFVSMSHSVVETMAAALGNGRPSFDYAPEYPLTDFDAKPLNGLIDCYWDADQWDVKTYHTIDQMLAQGWSPVYIYWDINRPRMMNLGLEDAFWDPALTSPMQLLNGEGYAGRRYMTTLDTLKTFEVMDTDPKSKTFGEMVPRFKNLDQVSVQGETSDSTDTDKALKDDFMGSSVPNAEASQVCVYEVQDADWITSIANRKTVIERVENPHKIQHRMLLEQEYIQKALQEASTDPLADLEDMTAKAEHRAKVEAKGLITIAWARNYVDISQFPGRSEIDPIAAAQETLNDMTNQNVDAITHQIAPERFIDPKYASWINKIGQSKPGRILPLPKGAMEWADPPVIPAGAFNERMNIKNEIREATAIDQVAKGVSDDSNPTATQIRAQLNQAGQRIEIKARMLEKDFFYQVGTIVFRLVQLYVREPVPVTVQSDNGPIESTYDPTVYQGMRLLPKVTLEITAQQKREKERTSALEAYEILSLDPSVNPTELKKLFIPKMFDIEASQLEALLTPAPMAMGELPPGAPPMPAEAML
jgi:hypothetical protein